MKKSILLMVLFSVTMWNSYAQEKGNQHNFTIQQCIEYAKKNSSTVKNALLDIQIQNQINRGVTAAALPQLTGSGNSTNYLNIPTTLVPAQFFGGPVGSFAPVTFGTKYSTTATVQLQQMLFDGQVFVGLQARSTLMQYQQKALEVTEENIKVNVYKVYYQLVVSKSQIDLLDANIERIEKLLKDVKEIYRNGFAEQLDIDKLTVQLSNIKTDKEKVLNSVQMGYVGLKTLIGMPIKEILTLKDSITYDDVKSGLLTDTASMYNNRKEFHYLQLVKKLDEYNIRRYKLAYLPTISATGSYSKNAQRDKFTFFDKGDWFTTSFIGLNVNIPIFDGFTKDAKVKQSRFELQQTMNSIDNFKLSVENDVEQATLKFNSATATLESQKKNMDLATKVYDQTKKKFEAGTGSNTEINTAQTDLKSAQTNYISAMYDAIIAKVDYLKAIGKLQ